MSYLERKEELRELIYSSLKKNEGELREQFDGHYEYTATRHFILDDLIPDELALEIYRSFPKDTNLYTSKSSFRESKYTFTDFNEEKLPILAAITDVFHEEKVLNQIMKITNLESLEADPSLYAGGLSRMDMGHFNNPHIDNSHNSSRLKYRRLNLLFYLTPNVSLEDGGSLELWNKDVTLPLKIPARFNRLVVMETTKDSYHSVDPVLSPISRFCVSNYYFSERSPNGNDYFHVTSFTGRPNQHLRRTWGKVDNMARNMFVNLFGFSRGKSLARPTKVK